MTPEDTYDYAHAVAAVLKPKRLPRSGMRAILVQLGTTGEEAEAIIERALAEGLCAEVDIFGEPYLIAAPPKA